ncbi:MAG: hypothetical protein Q8M16_24700 [Pirellulaceae bacterium]|nr:hypothetical protein [Pirellulaceae bacterium]
MIASLNLAFADSLSAQQRAIGSGVRKAAAPWQVVPAAEPTTAQLSPIQELHRRAYYQAIQAGYNPAQAKAHADSVAQNATAAQQQTHPNPYPPQVQHPQQWEQHRVNAQQQMAAAQQNARLWESVQRQRGVIAQTPQPNRAAGQRTPMAMQQNQMPTPVPAQQERMATRSNAVDEAEARGVRAASAQLAKMHARSERIDTAVEAATLAPPAAPPMKTPVAPPARLVGTPRLGTTSTAPRSVLEPASELELPGPQASNAAPPTPATLLPSTPPAANPQSAPRVPRKLPNVDPKPLQRPRSNLEVELEGFTGEMTNDGGEDEPNPATNQQVAYQQPLQAPSYARRDYVPTLGQGGAATPAPAQLVGRPMPPAETNVHGFAVEPVPTGMDLALPTESLNAQWDEQNHEFTVPPPTGIRVNPVSSGGRRMGSRRVYSQDEPNDGNLQEKLEEVPPLSVDRSDSLQDESVVGMKTCADLRQELLGVRLSDISLDLSTPASTLEPSEASAAIRDWRDGQDQVIATGRVVSVNGQAVRIVENGGTERTLQFSNLSAKDQQAAWESLDLPFECEFLGTEAYCRSFAPTHVAWHASNLCHKPLYFEDIQLERYGHTVGPIKQPVKSAAKFLIQAALLPYQMALHPPNECQYPLGLFRPGNCAPYLRPPFPWERRAIGYQAGVATGLFLIVP